MQDATQNFELPEWLQTGIDELLPKVHPVLKRWVQEKTGTETKKETVEIEAETKTAEVLAAEVLAAEVLAKTAGEKAIEKANAGTTSSSTDRPKKAPKAPLPPGSAG